MSERLTRGYGIKQVVDYIDRTYDQETRDRVYATLPDDVRDALPNLDPAKWYPWRYNAAMFEGVASTQSEEGAVYDELVRCGESIAVEATNTFLRFLMKILTPKMFATKIPEFWSRDNKGGRFDVDLSEADQGRIRLSLSGVEGYNHIGVGAIGWITFGMKATGKNATITQSGWSLETPGPDKISYLVTWTD